MPSVSAYKKGFGVKKDLIVTSQSGVEWTVKRCAIEHIEAIKYERYEFPTVLVLTSSTGSGAPCPPDITNMLFFSLIDRLLPFTPCQF